VWTGCRDTGVAGDEESNVSENRGDSGLTGRHAANLSQETAVHHDGNGHALHAPVLVLNASYEPINVCAAAVLWFWC